AIRYHVALGRSISTQRSRRSYGHGTRPPDPFIPRAVVNAIDTREAAVLRRGRRYQALVAPALGGRVVREVIPSAAINVGAGAQVSIDESLRIREIGSCGGQVHACPCGVQVGRSSAV